MKKIIFLSLVIALIIGSCIQEKKLPIEGAWQLIYKDWGAVDTTFPALVKGSAIKMFSENYYIVVGRFVLDTLTVNSYGYGTYTLNVNKYEETVRLHHSESNIGKTIRILLEVKNDTLTQSWPVDENWNLQEKYRTEKYIRIK